MNECCVKIKEGWVRVRARGASSIIWSIHKYCLSELGAFGQRQASHSALQQAHTDLQRKENDLPKANPNWDRL